MKDNKNTQTQEEIIAEQEIILEKQKILAEFIGCDLSEENKIKPTRKTLRSQENENSRKLNLISKIKKVFRVITGVGGGSRK